MEKNQPTTKRSSFTDQKPRIATEEDCNASYAGYEKGKAFRCHICGYRFIVGDTWRWVYAAHKNTINFLVCQPCDGPDVLSKWVEHVEEGRRKYWWRWNR